MDKVIDSAMEKQSKRRVEGGQSTTEMQRQAEQRKLHCCSSMEMKKQSQQ